MPSDTPSWQNTTYHEQILIALMLLKRLLQRLSHVAQNNAQHVGENPREHLRENPRHERCCEWSTVNRTLLTYFSTRDGFWLPPDREGPCTFGPPPHIDSSRQTLQHPDSIGGEACALAPLPLRAGRPAFCARRPCGGAVLCTK